MPALEILLLFALLVLGTFLILVVLVQRGRGGGLTGALGGMGGQSAFGSKAGDTFTKVTVWTAIVWILLCVVAVKYLSTSRTDTLGERGGESGPTTISEPNETKYVQSKTSTGPKKGQPAAGGPSSTPPAPSGSATPPPPPQPPASKP